MLELERRIILKGDDRGNLEAINRGIDELVKRGLLTDVALIIQFTDEQERDLLLSAIDQSPNKENPGVGILLHVNLVTGEPISNPKRVSSLVDAHGILRRPPKPTRVAWEEYAKTLVPGQVRKEIDAQVERFFRIFGHYPHALDSHHISLYFPPLDQIAIEVALQLAVPITIPKLFTNKLTQGSFPEVLEVHKGLLDEYKRQGIVSADWGEVEYWNRFENLDDSVERILGALRSLQPGITEFFFHPGHPSFVDQVEDPRFARGKVRDFEILTHSKVSEVIRTLPLTSYKQLFHFLEQTR